MSAVADIEVEIITPSDVSIGRASVPVQVRASDIAAEIAQHLNLPLFQGGNRIEYHLMRVQHDRNLPDEQTLVEAGVQVGEKLKLVSSAPVQAPTLTDTAGWRDAVGPGDATVTVSIDCMVDNHRGKRIEDKLPLDKPASALVNLLMERLNLPITHAYSLSSKAIGRRINANETLRGCNIPNNDSLTLAAEISAGGWKR